MIEFYSRLRARTLRGFPPERLLRRFLYDPQKLLVQLFPCQNHGDGPAVGAVFDPARDDGVGELQQLLGLGVPAGLDCGLAGDGLQNLVAQGVGVQSPAEAQRFGDLLQRGGRVRVI